MLETPKSFQTRCLGRTRRQNDFRRNALKKPGEGSSGFLGEGAGWSARLVPSAGQEREAKENRGPGQGRGGALRATSREDGDEDFRVGGRVLAIGRVVGRAGENYLSHLFAAVSLILFE